jgi:hypothetical protein
MVCGSHTGGEVFVPSIKRYILWLADTLRRVPALEAHCPVKISLISVLPAVLILWNRPLPLPSTSFTIHCSSLTRWRSSVNFKGFRKMLGQVPWKSPRDLPLFFTTSRISAQNNIYSWYSIIPNGVVEWLTFVLRIWEVPGSNLVLDSTYPYWGFSWVSSVLPCECSDNTLKLDNVRLLPNPVQFIIHLSP